MRIAKCKIRRTILPFAICLSHFAVCNLLLARDEEPVGHSGVGRTVTPVNQVLTPLGRQVDLPGMRPQAVALSPDGKLLVVSGKTSELVVLDAEDGAIRQRVELPSDYQFFPPKPVSPQILNP